MVITPEDILKVEKNRLERKDVFYVRKPEWHKIPNMNMIHPLKQEKIYDLYNAIINFNKKNNNSIKSVYIFGSSTKRYHDKSSDIDICFDVNLELGNEIYKMTYEAVKCPFDIIFFNDLDYKYDEKLIENIKRGAKIW